MPGRAGLPVGGALFFRDEIAGKQQDAKRSQVGDNSFLSPVNCKERRIHACPPPHQIVCHFTHDEVCALDLLLGTSASEPASAIAELNVFLSNPTSV